MNEITLNLQKFSEIISNNVTNKDLVSNFFNIFIKYKESLVGCNCNKEKRQKHVNLYFKKMLLSYDKKSFDKLKCFLNVEKINFQDENNQLFLEV